MKRYTPPSDPANKNSRNIEIAFDVGHSSIGWAVLETSKADAPKLQGCGVVIFQADDCLASQRRVFRRQRRHIRATRLRIARIKSLLTHIGVLTAEQLNQVSTSSPWFYAARSLASEGKEKLTWPQLWDIIRWYAHNRGYDGNRAWSRYEQDDDQEDTDKVEQAKNLLSAFKEKYGREGSMAEIWCDLSDLDPLGSKTSTHLPNEKNRPKAQNAAFPRAQVVRELKAILHAQIGTLPCVDESLIAALLEDWNAIPCSQIHLPSRYRGGLLFGQLIPRFNNRIVATCPVTFEYHFQRVLTETGNEDKAKGIAEKLSKVPSSNCPEFFRYRWAMQLANIQVRGPSGLRRLTADERQAIHTEMTTRGFLKKTELKQLVRKLTNGAPDNLDQMLMHPDAEKALVLNPVQRLLTSSENAPILATLPEHLKKRLAGKLRRGEKITLANIRMWLGEDTCDFDNACLARLETASTRRRKNSTTVTKESLLATILYVEPATGRAPHSRMIMAEVFDFVLSTNRHPAEEGGPLYRNEAVRAAQLRRAIDEQTNNHLVRHRLKILERLHRDVVASYAAGNFAAVHKITIEVNRDLREYSGKTAKQIARDLGQRLNNFKSVSAILEQALQGKAIPITPGLIRKARIAEDQGWTCPYTGKAFDVFDLIHRRVDKDHIIPRSDRCSDSLDSLVITFNEVNKWKGKRTAYRFVEAEQSKQVPGVPHLFIKPLSNYLKDVDALEAFKGHNDDIRRKKNRKRLLALPDYVEKEFVPRDLTQTSQLVRIGAQVLQKEYSDLSSKPAIISLPGSVTGTLRKSWKLLGCLPLTNGSQNGEPQEIHTKTEIRGITHLHHALDACILVFASHFLPRGGDGWELLVKRRLNDGDRARARALFKNSIQIDKDGSLNITDLPSEFKLQIRTSLAERRVVQHISKDLSGLRADMNAWRVIQVSDDGIVTLRQKIRQADGRRILKPERKEKLEKLVGLQPGKLFTLKAALPIADNYGLALDPEPTIIPFHKVWNRLRELRKKNGGKPVRVLRNGMLIRLTEGKYAGVWRIFSIKNAAAGILLDLGLPDVVRLQNKTYGHRFNIRFTGLLDDGLTIPSYALDGIPSGTGTLHS